MVPISFDTGVWSDHLPNLLDALLMSSPVFLRSCAVHENPKWLNKICNFLRYKTHLLIMEDFLHLPHHRFMWNDTRNEIFTENRPLSLLVVIIIPMRKVRTEEIESKPIATFFIVNPTYPQWKISCPDSKLKSIQARGKCSNKTSWKCWHIETSLNLGQVINASI